ncbi:flavodoxin [Erysipelotrichaceae bacterium 51-3]
MKKIWKTMFSLVMMTVLAACSSSTGSSLAESSAASASSASTGSLTGNEPTSMVVVFSATGNTMEAANLISEQTGVPIFEVTPVQPYTDEDLNYNDPDSRVSKEHDDESLRTIALESTTPDNWNSVETVYLGYPIWWGIAGWPMSSFVQAVDFEGKTVYPFCTSVSSGVGESAVQLSEIANGGDWKEGVRFSPSPSSDEIQEWLSAQ